MKKLLYGVAATFAVFSLFGIFLLLSGTAPKAHACYNGYTSQGPSIGSESFSIDPADTNTVFTGTEMSGSSMLVNDCVNANCLEKQTFSPAGAPLAWWVTDAAGNIVVSTSTSFNIVKTVAPQNSACNQYMNPTPAEENPPQSIPGEVQFSISLDTSAWSNGGYVLHIEYPPFKVGSADQMDASSLTVQHAASGGVISVTSEDAVNTSTLVNAAWDLTGPVANSVNGIVCIGASGNVLWNGASCSGTQQTYSGLPTDDSEYTLPDATTNMSHYALRSIKRIPVAEKKGGGVLETAQLSLKNVFSTIALAETIGVSGVGLNINSIMLDSHSHITSAAFVILWDPQADMQVSPNSVSLNSSNAQSQTVRVTNTGAPDSTLTWTATATTADGNDWLNVPSSGVSGDVPISLNSSVVSGLADGTYSGTVTFSGYNGSNNNQVATQSVAVTLVVSNTPNPPGSTSTLPISNPTSTPPGNPTSTPPLSACTPGVNCPVCSPSLAANPSSIVVPESSKLSYSCSNVTECQLTLGNTVLQDIGGGASQTVNSTYSVTPSITTVYTLTCVNSNYLRNGSNPVSTSATVTVSGSSYCEQNPNGAGCPGK